MMHEVLSLEALQAISPEEAAAWLVYRQADGAGELDAAVREEWLRLDPSHRVAWDDAQDSWADFNDAEDDEILAAMRADALATGAGRAERPGWTLRWAAAAAVVVLTLGGVVGLGVQQDWGGAKPPAVAAGPQSPNAPAIAYANREGAPQAVRLADGTIMTLDSASTARVAIGAGRREVQLAQGRAFFDVAHDATRPFAVRAAGQEVVALGTRFDVRIRPDQMQVVLVEGRVSVRPLQAAGEAIILRPGQQLLVRDGQPPVVEKADIEDATAWQARYVVFDNVTLAEAAEQLNRLGTDRLVVRDPKVASLRITGRFRAGDLPRFGRSLALLHPVRLVRRSPTEWEIVAGR